MSTEVKEPIGHAYSFSPNLKYGRKKKKKNYLSSFISALQVTRFSVALKPTGASVSVHNRRVFNQDKIKTFTRTPALGL